MYMCESRLALQRYHAMAFSPCMLWTLHLAGNCGTNTYHERSSKPPSPKPLNKDASSMNLVPHILVFTHRAKQSPPVAIGSSC